MLRALRLVPSTGKWGWGGGLDENWPHGRTSLNVWLMERSGKKQEVCALGRTMRAQKPVLFPVGSLYLVVVCQDVSSRAVLARRQPRSQRDGHGLTF